MMILDDHDNWLGRFLIPASKAIDDLLRAFDDEIPWILDSRRQEVGSQRLRLRDLWAAYPEKLKNEQADVPAVDVLLESIAAHLEAMGRTFQQNSAGHGGCEVCAVCAGHLLETSATAFCLDCTISGVSVESQFEPPWGDSCPRCGGSQIHQAPKRRFCPQCVGPIMPAVRGLRCRFRTGLI